MSVASGDYEESVDKGDDEKAPAASNGSADRGEPFAVVAIASSAGGIVALRELFSALRADFPLPVLVVQHLDRARDTVLAEVLGSHAQLPIRLATDGDRARPGAVYLAPPDHHMLVGAGGVLALTQTELVHFVRPSADLLFESVAAESGRRAVACVLTGTGKDGAMGVEAVHSRGGTVMVQDPASADFAGMPQAAVDTGVVDLIVPLEEMAEALTELVWKGVQR